MVKDIPPILEIAGILISSEILTEYFCCDYEKCKGICCVEGDAGAPVTMEEIAAIEESLDIVWGDLSILSQALFEARIVYLPATMVITASVRWRRLSVVASRHFVNPSVVPFTPFVRRTSAMDSLG